MVADKMKEITCPKCGYTFITYSKTGETHCGYCYSRIVFDKELCNRIKRERRNRMSLEQREKERKTKQLYYQKNREKIRRKWKEYYRENAEKIKEYVRQWREAHPDYMKKWRLLHRQKILQQKKLWYQQKKEERVRILGGKCQICGYDKCIAALVLHHLNQKEKERDKDWVKNDFDPSKYMLLCANCHEELHWKQNNISSELTWEKK